MTEPEVFGVKAKTAAAWKKNKRHEITLSSGTVVAIEIPNLPQMIKTGQIPNDLLDAALGAIQQEAITKELLSEQSDFYGKLVAHTVKEPAITEEDVVDLPFEDVELIVAIATRQRDVDALGHHIAGLHKSEEWRTFRGFESLD